MKTFVLQKLAVFMSIIQQLFKNASNPFFWLISFFGSGFTALIGGYDIMVQVLVIFIAFDYISGLIASGSNGELSSKIGFRGIAKKLLILMLVVLGHQLDTLLGFTFIRNALIFFYVANETISILENVKRMDMKTPPILEKIIDLLMDKANPPIPESKDHGQSNSD